MLEEFIELWLSLGLGMIGGVLAWLAIEWLRKPIAAFLALRGSVIEELHFYAAVDEDSPPEIREEARNRLRQLSRKMYEFNDDLSMSLHLYFSWRHADFRLAVEGLVGIIALSTSTARRIDGVDARYGGTRNGVTPHLLGSGYSGH